MHQRGRYLILKTNSFYFATNCLSFRVFWQSLLTLYFFIFRFSIKRQTVWV
uniref:Cyclic nucleotide-gated ion channel n=1 Tax=Rhizophora mucronata TaxID=61149 RepID=A0A2P2MAI6_RHIMU